MDRDSTGSEIAVIGMAVRLPGARTLSEYWRNLRDGVEASTFLSDADLLVAGESPDALRDPHYVRANSCMPDLDRFDAGFFGFSPQDAAIMDPQHRVMLEVAWEALENAGQSPDSFPGNIGVWATCGMNSYMMHNLLNNRNIMETVGEWLVRHTGNDMNFLATRISYELNLKGPSMNVQTACSSALVAIHQAAQSLLSGECDMALAGGCTINHPYNRGYVYKPGEILSPDGHCRPFDAKSAGTIFGSGAGMVVLRRLADAVEQGDPIAAVLLGSAVNNDGSMKVGYLVPGVDGQSRVITEALAASGVKADTVSYIETHGTGTHVGDPIEVAALTQAYRAQTRRKSFCAIGSVKSSIGHLGEAAGAAGFIKTVLALQNRKIPASLNFESANPQIDFANSPFYVNASLRDWDAEHRRAGVTALGAGGTNCHLLVEQAGPTQQSGPSRPWQLLTLSAANPAALDEATENLARHLKENPGVSLADTAYTLQRGRKAFPHRRAMVCRDVHDAVAALEYRPHKGGMRRVESDPGVAFLFTGQGAQYHRMGYGLYQQEKIFRITVDRCSEILKPHLQLDLRDLLYRSEDSEAAEITLRQTQVAQPALFVIEYAMAQLWMSWGIRPKAMIGHSVGEYAAACVAGVFSLEQALSLVAARGRLMQQLPTGSMLAVCLPAEETERRMNGNGATGRISLAAINAPAVSVVAGASDVIDAFQAKLTATGVVCQKLHTSHAFHSSMMDPALAPFRDVVRKTSLKPPAIPFISNVTGTWIRAEEATDPDYWAQHLRQPVRFAEGAATLLQDPNQVLLEVGPGHTLSALIRQQPAKPAASLSSLRRPKDDVSDVAFLLNTCGQMWSAGVRIDWRAFWAGENRLRLNLPTYPFQRQRYWIDRDTDARPAIAAPSKVAEARAPLQKKEDIADWFYLPSWKRTVPARPAPHRAWLLFADEAGLGDRLAEKLAQPQAIVRSRLELAQPGEVDSLRWSPESRRGLAANEVEIEVRATALNFADVLKATGAMPDAPFGMECAGVIAALGSDVKGWRVGDEVVAIGPESHATHVIRDARFLASKPASLAFENAAALPAVYMTAWYALQHVTQLKRGEKILIHAAAGGVGLAAVRIAQRTGAEIYATAGSPEKRAYLESLGVKHVYGSRTLDFADQIPEKMDVVLNSLTGDFIPRSLGLLAPGGRFLEIGKKEILSPEHVPAGISYSPIDLTRLLRDDPDAYGTLLNEVMDLVRTGELAPLETKTFAMRDVAAAFQYMLQTRHIGKVALSLQPTPRDVYIVRAGKNFRRIADREFAINPGSDTDYEALLEALSSAQIDSVAHLWNVTPDGSRAPWEEHLNRGFFSLMGVAKALGRLDQQVDLCVVSNGLHDVAGETETEPAKATLIGPCRVIPREFENLRCRSIDVKLARNGGMKLLLDQLTAELDSASVDPTVAYRGADRWTQTLEAAPVDEAATSAALRKHGVYLITGGMGGIGLEIAAHLARTVQAKLVLVGRTALPPQSEWKQWLASHLESDATSRKIRRIQSCEAMGAQVLTIQADVADAAQMRAAMRQVAATFGAIHGAFHTAGLIRDGLIQMKEPAAALSVLSPKVKGALVLHDLLKSEPLDFLMLFSSVSSILGLEGQVDYTAANAFLDAFAQQESKHGPRIISVNWGAWKEVGLAAAAARSREARTVWFEQVRQEGSEKTFTSAFSPSKQWLLAEHAIKNSGSILPGTGYLELARAAFEEIPEPRTVELRQVYFQSPFFVEKNQTKDLSITLDPDGFRIQSESQSVTHVIGQISYVDATAPVAADLAAIRARCNVRREQLDGFLKQEFMDFGPRWGNVRQIDYGRDEALLSLELPAEFAADLEHVRLHPALLDMATGGAQPLLPDFDPAKHFYVPFSYASLRLYRTLTPKIFSHVRLRNGAFDMTLLDDQGDVLAEINGFVMRPMADRKAVAAPAPKKPVSAADEANAVLAAGILPAEGMDVIGRLLAHPTGPRMIVTSVDLPEWLRQIDSKKPQPSAAKGQGGEVSLQGDQLERRLAEMWKSILGVDAVGLQDDFFQLGGHSLLLVRLATRIEKELKKAIPLTTMFESPTIEKMAACLREGTTSSAESEFFVPFQPVGEGPAFFCVHTIGGEVNGLRHLAKRVDPAQRFYGIQTPMDIYTAEFASSVEGMATRYVEELLKFEPNGPYILGGWSAGSPVALEMSRQLQARGHKVEMLVSFDGAPFNSNAGTKPWNPLFYWKLACNFPRWFAANFEGDVSWTRYIARMSGKLGGMAKKLTSLLRGEKDYAKYEVRGFLGGADFSTRGLVFMEAYFAGLYRYVPQPYGGRVLLYQAKTEPLYHLHEVDLVWGSLTKDLEVVRVEGNHTTLLDEDRIGSFIEHLNTRLREVREKHAG